MNSTEGAFLSRNPREGGILRERHVSVIGCGSVGGALADMLVRAGLGRITLVDPDVFAESNAGRHVLTPADAGEPKVRALGRHLTRINPRLNVETRQERFATAGGLLLSCTDSQRCASRVNAVSLETGNPAVFVGIYGAARAGEVFFSIPGRTACYECFAAFRPAAHVRISPEKYTDPDFDETRLPSQEGLWGSILAVAAFAFHVSLGLLGARPAPDPERPLMLVNFDYPGLPECSVVRCKVEKGCPVCDEGRVSELSL